MDIDRYTEFVTDLTFFQAAYPILFSCHDKHGNLYLSVCCQNDKDGVRWLLKETSPSIIIEMLKDKITMREAFLKGKGKQLSCFYNYKEMAIKDNDPTEWDAEESIYLPTKGEYIESEPSEFDEEINTLENLEN